MVGGLFLVLYSSKAQEQLRKLYDQAKGTVSEAVESVREKVDEVVEPTEEDLTLLAESGSEEDLSIRLSLLARYFPDGSYFTTDASPCIHTDGGFSCPDGTCAYGRVVNALESEVWWEKICGGEWECACPDAYGSESFARFLYHAMHGAELDAEPVPAAEYEITDLGSVSGMVGALRTGDLIRFRGEHDHWAVFLESAGLNVYFFEANRDGCEGISYRRAEALESLVSRFSGCTAEIYRR